MIAAADTGSTRPTAEVEHAGIVALKRAFGTGMLQLQFATFQYISTTARCDTPEYDHRNVKAETLTTRHRGCADDALFSSCV